MRAVLFSKLFQYISKRGIIYITYLYNILISIDLFEYPRILEKLLYFRYHVELVKLLACCTMGKNVNTEIKCHSLLPLDDIAAVVSHPDCIPEVNFSIEFVTYVSE